jgi:F-type H+-transporting ATPase subunit b
MLIDWFTVGAQIINFLVLVWLLKKFLYGPIVHAVDERERRIAGRLAEAREKEEQAAQERAQYEAKVQELEAMRESMLAQMRTDVERNQSELIEKARARVQTLETEWQEEVDRERREFLAGLRRRMAEEVLAMTRRVVTELASVDVQRCAVEAFLDRLRTLPEDRRTSLDHAELCLRTEFKLPEAEQARIRGALEERLAAPVTLRFEQAERIGLGVELEGDGWRIGWNSARYLESLEENVKEELEVASHER